MLFSVTANLLKVEVRIDIEGGKQPPNQPFLIAYGRNKNDFFVNRVNDQVSLVRSFLNHCKINCKECNAAVVDGDRAAKAAPANGKNIKKLLITYPDLSHPDDSGQRSQGGDLSVGRRGDVFGSLSKAVAPDHAKSESLGGMSIPGIRRDEANLIRFHSKSIGGESIDVWVRLVDPHFLGRQHLIKKTGNSGIFDRSLKHLWFSVGKCGKLHAVSLQLCQRIFYLRVCTELQVKRHQAVAQCRVFDLEAGHGEIKGISGYLPEVRMLSHQAAQPGVLKLLGTPKVGQRQPLVSECALFLSGSAGKIK